MKSTLKCVCLMWLAVAPPASAGSPSPGGVGAVQVADSPSPLAGRWVANLSKSSRDPNHQFQSSWLEITVVGDSVTLAYGGINAGGQEEHGEAVFEADGRERPVPVQPDVTMLAEWSSPTRLRTLGKKGGSVVGEGIYEVSADGRTLTATVSGVDASGSRFEQVIVYDRDEP
jgi:hypothetical protein